MKERRVSMDVGAEEDESLPSRVSSSKFILENCDRSRSHHSYPREPSPLHFTHLNSPVPDGYNFMPSPLRSYSFDKLSRRRGRFGSSCCCCSIVATLCSIFFTACILLGLTALITWLILRPIQAPRYSVDNLEFKSLSVSGDEYSLNADVVVTITTENRNRRLGFKYDAVGIETSYRGYVFGHSEVSSFSMGHGNVTTLTSEFILENYFFTPAGLGGDLSADVYQFASVAVHVRASAKVRVQVGVITSFAVKVFVDCDFVVKPPNGTAPSSVISRTCKLTR